MRTLALLQQPMVPIMNGEGDGFQEFKQEFLDVVGLGWGGVATPKRIRAIEALLATREDGECP